MTAVMRRLACLLLVLIAIPSASADLRPLASAACEHRNRLYNLPAIDLEAAEARAELQELAAGPDQAAEKLAESMIPVGYEDYQLWMDLVAIKSSLGKGLQAAHAAYLATEAAFGSREKAAAHLALGEALE